MNRLALVVLVAACGEGDKPHAAASPPPPPAKETLTAQLASCTVALPAPVDPRERVVDTAGSRGQSTPSPRALLGNPTVNGTYDRDVVRRVLRGHLAKFQHCFEKQLLVNPRLAGGTAETAFAIQPTGHVASPTADGIDREVDKCFATALQSVAFPAPYDGNQTQVSVQIVIRHAASQTDPAATLVAPPQRVPHEWTPFAAGEPPAASVTETVENVTQAVRSQLPALDKCFDGAKGVVRAMLAISQFGKATQVRAGGLGDVDIERCVATALGVVQVSAGPSVELACDITRGGDAPLRVSPDAGYTVIEVTDREVRTEQGVRELPPRGAARTVTALGETSTVLVIAEPGTPAHGIDFALWWAPPGTTLVAVKASGGAPVFLGMGDSRAERQAVTGRRVVQLRTDGGRMRACIPGEQLDASAVLLDPRQMDAVMHVVKLACDRQACEPTIVVGTSGDFVAKDLVATTSAARRAGFASISIGGPACN